jgi:ribosomal-protein-alanine N-acetyltransferase
MIVPPLPHRLRPLAAADLPAVDAIEKQLFLRPMTPPAYLYELEKNDLAHYQALERQGPDGTWELIGYGGFWIIAGEVHISIIAVRPDLQGQGLGELLLLNMLLLGSQKDNNLATLEVRESNLVAQGLYRKYGFKQVGRRRRYYKDTGEDALLMSVESYADGDYLALLEARKQQLFIRLASARITQGRV